MKLLITLKRISTVLLVFPIPRLLIRTFFVALITRMLALCDTLESRLKEWTGVQGRIANAIVKNVADA
jgi:hypothetical protein